MLEYGIMKRLTIYITVGALALLVGVASTWIFQINYPRFRSKGGSSATGYTIHNFESSDVEEITLYHEFTSPEQTRYLFQSNLTASKIVEQGSKLNEKGKKVGERAVIVFPSDEKHEVARIFWTEGEEFWFVQASSLELAREFENSEMFRSARSQN
jgi:hypothetical protein